MTAGGRRPGRGKGASKSSRGRKAAGTGTATEAPADLARERRVRGALAELRALLDTGEVDPERTRAMLAGELEAAPVDADDVPTSIRAPRALLERAEALAASLPTRPSRSAVLRMALERGMAELEAEARGLPAPVAAELRAEIEELRRRVEALEGASVPPSHGGEFLTGAGGPTAGELAGIEDPRGVA